MTVLYKRMKHCLISETRYLNSRECFLSHHCAQRKKASKSAEKKIVLCNCNFAFRVFATNMNRFFAQKLNHLAM